MKVNRHSVILPLVGLLTLPAGAPAQMQGDREVLRLAAAKHQANRERIQTWKGRATVFEAQQPRGREVHATVEFIYDAQKDALRWKWTYDRIVHPFEKDRLPGEVVSVMIRDGKYYMLSSSYEYDPVRRPVATWLTIGPREFFARGRWQAEGSFFPMYHFNYPASAHHWETVFHNYHKSFDHPMASGRVERDGDLFTLELTAPDTTQRFRFDLSRGANLIDFQSTEEYQETIYELGWQQVDGIWMPKTWMYANLITHDTEHRKRGEKSVRRVQWASHVVNQPIDESEFSYEAVGLQPGQKILNGLTGESTTFKGSGLGANVPEHSSQRNGGDSSTRAKWIIGGNVVLFTMLAAVGCYRWTRWRRRAGRSCA